MSVLLSLVFPVCLLVVVVFGRLFLLLPFAWVLQLVSVTAIPGTLVTGHLALAHAKRYPPAQPGQRLANTALVLGYLSLAVVLLYVVLVIVLIISGNAGGE
jgi:hypothetical protein